MSDEPAPSTTVRLPPYIRVEDTYGVIVCTEHRCGYTIKNVSEHLQRAHGLKGSYRKALVQQLTLLSISEEVHVPPNHSTPTTGLPILSGWRCNVHICTFLSQSLEVTERHCSRQHGLVSKPQRQERHALSEVLLQKWFAKSSQYWIVNPQPSTASTPIPRPSSTIPFSSSPPPASSHASPLVFGESILH